MYVGSPAGVSMRPFLRDRRDTIVVEPLHGRRLRRFEVALYRRGDAYVLHRVVGVGDRSYTMLGDNCLNKELGIPDELVIGILAGCYRGEKRVDLEGVPYRAYVRLWYAAYPLRRVAMRMRWLAGRARRRTLGAFGFAGRPSESSANKSPDGSAPSCERFRGAGKAAESHDRKEERS